MVSATLPTDDRAQLILVGCVVIAFIVVSVTLVINTSLYTQSAAPALSNDQVEDARAFDLETRKGTRALVHRINHGERDRDASTLQSDVGDGVASYDGLLAESYARSEPASVSVTYNPAPSQYGTRVVQAEDGDFEDVGGGNLLGSDQTVGWFAVNVDVFNTSDDASGSFELTVDDTAGETLEMRLYQNDSSNLTVRSSIGPASDETTCDPIRDRVLVDVYEGQVVGDHCTNEGSVQGIEDLDGRTRALEFDNRDEVTGRFEFVTDEADGSSLDDCTGVGVDPDDACQTAAVWTANVTTTYRGDGVRYENDRDVEIYRTD